MTAQSLTKTLKVALICAAGVGARAGGDVPKQYQLIHGVPMLVHTVRAFERSCVDAVCVVISPDDAWYDVCVAPLVGTAVQVLRVGGTSRASSVANGLLALVEDFHGQSWVLVHDAARPCISPSLIARLCESTTGVGGLLAVPVVDTVKKSTADGDVDVTSDRSGLWLAQTPQMFRLSQLSEALEHAFEEPDVSWITDEASVMEWAGFSPALVEGHVSNLKVTRADDFVLAGFWLNQLRVE